jgi:hypothetical protein
MWEFAFTTGNIIHSQDCATCMDYMMHKARDHSNTDLVQAEHHWGEFYHGLAEDNQAELARLCQDLSSARDDLADTRQEVECLQHQLSRSDELLADAEDCARCGESSQPYRQHNSLDYMPLEDRIQSAFTGQPLVSRMADPTLAGPPLAD